MIYKIGSLFFRAGAASQHLRDQQRKNFDANADAAATSTKKNKGGSKGGEYIDYEEVK
ncbi:MAG: hypothetical protein MUP26_04995 [Desulfobulbaceae bacterium]|nr:hypothetical protein [Desulfobulbaceae bacterium]